MEVRGLGVWWSVGIEGEGEILVFFGVLCFGS